MTIIVAPFSNSAIRDWPAASFSALIGHLLDEFDADERIVVIGARSQALRANAVIRPHPATRVANDCGREPWPIVAAKIRHAKCVVGNNSGVAHVAAYYGTPTVCVFGGSHDRREWRPIGANIALVSRPVWCSPCHIDHRESCRYDKSCLREIAVADVLAAVRIVMARTGESIGVIAADGNRAEATHAGPSLEREGLNASFRSL